MMKTVQAVVEFTPQQKEEINETFASLAEAQNFVVGVCYENEDTNTFRIHHKTYYKMRKLFALPAELAIVANKYGCAAVRGAIKRKIKKPIFIGSCIHYDKRSYSINIKKNMASLLTLRGRIKVKIKIPKYFECTKWKIKESNLVKCRDGSIRLMIAIETETIKSNKRGKCIGVDRGINNIIATSDGWLYESNHIIQVKRRSVRLRSRLQSKGTRSAKRHFSKVRGREQRFMRDVNHCISKRLIESAGRNGVIVLENLKGIRNAKHKHEQNWMFSNWAFAQLEQFLIYKGEEFGVAIEFVPARNTSKTCSKCGSLKKGQRQGSVFSCKTCGVVLHADLNAASNILHRFTDSAGCCQPAYCSPSGLSKSST